MARCASSFSCASHGPLLRNTTAWLCSHHTALVYLSLCTIRNIVGLTAAYSLYSLHTGGAPSPDRHDPRFDSITKLMASIFNMCACRAS